jgi:hypothetical protein
MLQIRQRDEREDQRVWVYPRRHGPATASGPSRSLRQADLESNKNGCSAVGYSQLVIDMP